MRSIMQVAFALMLLLFCVVPKSQAALYAVGPANNSAFGFFPIWYQDAHARSLELCLSQAVGGPTNGPMCILLPIPIPTGRSWPPA